MRVEVEYLAEYEYEGLVLVNDNELRVFPRSEPWQRPLGDTLESDPPGRSVFYTDRWGNRVARVTIRVPHTLVRFRAVSRVELVALYRAEPGKSAPLPLDPGEIPPEARIFLLPSRLADHRPLQGLARQIAGGARTVEDALTLLTRWVYERIEYKRGYTDVRTTAAEVVRIGKGVCQDKAHLLIALLRALGIPARYVSGALTDTPGETHAWAEAWHPSAGWIPVDPTHNRVFNLDHYYVKYAHGRDYNDVPPINGYYISRAKGRIKTVRVVPRVIE